MGALLEWRMGHSSADTAEDTIMRSSIISLIFLSVTTGRPQFEVLKSIVSEVVGDIEQVPYTVIQKFDGYEMRRYPSVNWVCSEATYKMGRDSKNNMFMKLFRYISGANVEQEKVDITIPVLTRMKMLENRMVNKEMCFYLNKAHQTNPPRGQDCEEPGAHRLRAHLRRLRQQGLGQHEGRQAVRLGAEEGWAGGGHRPVVHGQL